MLLGVPRTPHRLMIVTRNVLPHAALQFQELSPSVVAKTRSLLRPSVNVVTSLFAKRSLVLVFFITPYVHRQYQGPQLDS